MAGTFTASMDMLIEQAKGRWSAKCEVNQIYAHYQESHPEFHHPRGGQAFYLRDTIYYGHWLALAAQTILTTDGVDVKGALRTVAHGMVAGVYQRAPVEFNDLRRSGRAKVTRDFAEVYNRPPEVYRLSDEQLRHKSQYRYLYGRG